MTDDGSFIEYQSSANTSCLLKDAYFHVICVAVSVLDLVHISSMVSGNICIGKYCCQPLLLYAYLI